MVKVAIFVILCLLKAVKPNDLYCNFISHIDGYNCEVQNSFKEQITSVKGQHFSNFTNTDVQVLFAPLKSNLSNFPSGSCLYFENLLKFDINALSITDLSRSIFHGCNKVQKLNIMYTKIKEFDENLFYDLVTLEVLTISENSLEHLQRDIFKFNRHLRTIDLSYNKITSISSVFPSSVMIIKVFNNPCADRSFYPRDFHQLYVLCPDENKKLSLNLTESMTKFQELHLMIMKVADSAMNELDTRLNLAEQQHLYHEKKTKDMEAEAVEKSKVIESLERDFKNLAMKMEKHGEEIERLKEQQNANLAKIRDQITKIEQFMKNFSAERSSTFDNILERNALEENFGAERKFIYLAFAMNALLLATFILFAFIKMNRPSKRDAMLLSPFDT